jgi:hypothetical protein
MITSRACCTLLVAFEPAGGTRDGTTTTRPTAVDETYDIQQIIAELSLAAEGITLASLYPHCGA